MRDRSKRCRLLGALVLLAPALAAADDYPPIHHVNLTAAALAKAVPPGAAAPGLWIVQFSPAARLDAKRLSARGLEVLGYLPESAWIVRLDGDGAKALASLPALRLLPYAPELRIAPGTAPGGGLVVQAAPDVPASGLEASLAGLAGIEASTVLDTLGQAFARVRLDDGAGLDALAALDSVLWIEGEVAWRTENTDSIGVIQASGDSGGSPPINTPIWDQALLGSGQIVAVADSGLDRNEDWFLSIDRGNGVVTAATDAEAPEPPTVGTIHSDRKVVAYWVQPGASPYDDSEVCRDGGFPSTYHGTHVTGTVAGDAGAVATPTAPNHQPGDGMAPNAQILFQDIGNDETGCLSIVNFGDTIAQAYAGGARIHNNSWGAAPEDEQGNFAQAYYFDDFLGDLLTHSLQDLLLVTSAGNTADDFPAPQATIGPPGNGKNILTVGATERGNNAAIASFSSRGPGHDGRQKPDVVAPGVDIVSARGDNNDVLPPPPFGGDQSIPKSGTSMASPTVAGGAALARQYFTDGFYPSGGRNPGDALTPSGALMKAVLLNGTRLYSDTPSLTSGWGRLWLDHALHFAGEERRLRVWDLAASHGLVTGETHEYTVDVAAGEPFRATLVWFDPPATSGSGRALVNDLDLTVVAPTGIYPGNAISAGESRTDGAPDRLNPVEQVMLSDPAAGAYTLRVSAANVPGNAAENSTVQPYALVVTGAGCAATPDVPTLSATPSAFTVELETDRPAELFRAPGSCEAPPAAFRFVGAAPGGELSDARVEPGVTYAYRARAANACGLSAWSTCKSASVGAAALDVSGPWFNPEQSGHGWLVEQISPLVTGEPDRMTVYWYVFRDGVPVWLIAQGELEGGRAVLEAFITRGAQFPPAFDAADVEVETWGTLTIDFADDDSGLARWEPVVDDFAAGELLIQRLAPVARSPEACVSGSYFNPGQSGHGFVAEVFTIEGQLQVLVAWYVYLEGRQLWLLGQAPLTENAAELELVRYAGADFPPDFDPDAVTAETWGTLRMEFLPPDAATATWSPVLPGFEDGALELDRLSSLVGRSCGQAP